MEKLQEASFSRLVQKIQETSSIDEMVRMVRQIDALKSALEAVDEFREKAVLYARLEVEAILRVCELGGIKKLAPYHQSTAKWLVSISDEERDRYIDMCKEGLTIDQIYKREVKYPERLNERLIGLETERNFLVENLREDGLVDIQSFCERVRKTLPENNRLANDIIDGARNQLRRSGGISIGEGSFVYIERGSKDKEGVLAAIRLRFDSILRDLESIEEIASASDIKMSWKELYDFTGWELSNKPLLSHILIACSRLGIISDEQHLFYALENEDMRAEIDYVNKQAEISRETWIETEYKKIQEKRMAYTS